MGRLTIYKRTQIVVRKMYNYCNIGYQINIQETCNVIAYSLSQRTAKVIKLNTYFASSSNILKYDIFCEETLKVPLDLVIVV